MQPLSLSFSRSLYVVHCQLSLPLSLSVFPPPSPISSRNWSGSGSCRSMEIWVRTVYVIVASINALLICSGLQPLIHIIHPHARPSPNCCFTHKHTHISERNTPRQRGKNQKKKNNRKQQHEQRQAQNKKQNVRPLPCWCLDSLSDHQSIDQL